MDKIGEIITQDIYPDVYEWLSENVYYYKEEQRHYTLTSDKKINAYCGVKVKCHTTQIKYPFGYVNGYFRCNPCKYLTSLNGSPEEVEDDFDCGICDSLTSLIGSPKEVEGDFMLYRCKKLTSLKGFPKIINGDIHFYSNKFSNDPSDKEPYKLYLAMWLEFLESVSNEDRKEYITNYKDKKNYNKPIIPIEILKEYGF